MELWVTSDSHFRHANIIRYCQRPFSSVEEMDELLVQRWNEVVQPSDHVYHLGDVTMQRGSKGSQQARDLIQLIKRLHGHKRLVLGNHDHFPVEVYLQAGFEKIRGIWQGFEGFILSHVPVHPDSLGRRRNIHGHIHNRLVLASPHHPDERYINVCVEQTHYRPLTLTEVRGRCG